MSHKFAFLSVIVLTVLNFGKIPCVKGKESGADSLLMTGVCQLDGEWVFLANSYDQMFTYDPNRIERADSLSLFVWIKITPKPVFYLQIRSEQMMEHRMLEGCEDRSHPRFEYEGYEKYSFTIVHEEIDAARKKYRIVGKLDYDLTGQLLSKAETSSATPTWMTSIGAIAETAFIESVCNVDARKNFAIPSSKTVAHFGKNLIH